MKFSMYFGHLTVCLVELTNSFSVQHIQTFDRCFDKNSEKYALRICYYTRLAWLFVLLSCYYIIITTSFNQLC